jgi:tetratricopeptide (TPR) repeat protein
MNWLKKLLTKPKNIDKSKSNNIKPKEDIPIVLSISYKAFHSGIDMEFVSLIYFKDESDKEIYINEINQFLNNYKISNKTNTIERINKIVEFENTGKQIDFLRDVLNYEDYSIVTKNDKVTYSKLGNNSIFGLEKINDYYSALNFISTNLQRKIERNCLDFEFENNLFEKVVIPNNMHNYAYAATVTLLAIQHDIANQKEKSKYYLDKLFEQKELSSLANETLSNFFRKIGEYYFEIKEYEYCLKWLEAGIELNPKLGVKKKIIELKKLIGTP